MRQDTKFNLSILIVLFLGILFFYLFSQYNASKEFEKMERANKEIETLSDKIEKYFTTFNEYPQDLSEARFREFITDIPMVDPFNPGKKEYVYKVVDNHWKLYSVGPNKIDDGGTYKRGHELLDIVAEGGH